MTLADDGLTGTRMDQRDDFNRMLADCRKGKIDRVLVKSISRFARNTRDCLASLRELMATGVTVCFEKENIDTDTLTAELTVSVSAALAQEESVSISKNQRMSYQRRMERGEFITCYAPLGYRLADGKNLEIVPEEAEIIRWIFRQYLCGQNSAQIASELSRRGLATVTGKKIWNEKTVRKILGNEKYYGDALMFKTHTLDCISKRVVKNTGDWPMVHIEQSHEGIVPKVVLQRVQEEMARRASKRKVMQRHGKTEQGKYSAKYALSELLVCDECGTPYKRCTWARNGKKRIVWRCVSRASYPRTRSTPLRWTHCNVRAGKRTMCSPTALPPALPGR